MTTLTITSKSLEQEFKKLTTLLNGTLKITSKDYELAFNNELGSGIIRGIILPNLINFIEYDVVFNNDIMLQRTVGSSDAVYFIYSLKGDINYYINSSVEKQHLNEFQTCIFSSNITTDTIITFKKDIEYKLSVISVLNETHSKENLTDSIAVRIKETFDLSKNDGTYVHTGSYNLKIAEKIEQLEAISEKGIVRSLLVQGIVQTILALEIKQHQDDMEYKSNKLGSLCIGEIKKIRQLSDTIKKNPENQYSISNLCYEVGLSPSKLQEGFKILHKYTVNDFIRNERLIMAEKLIKNKDLTISEIVYTIGLTSRSYFSKIFKGKYNCSPKSYQDNYFKHLETI